VAVLLDFEKAYDTLDRRFLSLALRRHGFSDTLIRAVETMHLGTTAAYVAEGQTSATESVLNGIRQGCPFAPTLFILAIDVLYDMVETNPRLPGLRLTDNIAVSIVGFADDTKVYVNFEQEAVELERVLDAFAEASGLRVNKSKSVAVRLLPSKELSEHIAGFPVAAHDQLVRYLGAQISTTPQPGLVWDVVLQQLRARLHLAEVKTTDLLQRIQVCRVIILPKILYVARHTWPSAKQLQRLQRFVHTYAWHGQLTEDGVCRRAWMSAALASVRHQDGGLELPRIRDELLTMSASTVSRWLSAQSPLAAAVGGVLLSIDASEGSACIAPGRKMVGSPRVRSTLALSGWQVLSFAARHERDVDEENAVAPLLALAGRAPLSQGWWEDGWYYRDFSRHAPQLQIISRMQRERRGPLNTACLLATPLLAHGLLLGVDGRELRASDFPVISDPQVRVGDLLDLEFVRTRVVRFRIHHEVFPYREVGSFRTLCDLLIFQYPELLARLPDPTDLVERSASKDSWTLRRDRSDVRLYRAHGTRQVEDLGVVESLVHAQAVARRATGRRRVHFAPHVWLCPVLPLWGSVELYAKKRLHRLIARPTADRALREQEARAHRAVAQSPLFAAALERVGWDTIFDLSDSSSRQRLTFLKVKGLRLSGWDVGAQRRGCPHCAQAGSAGGETFHIVWDCPSAQRLWGTLRSWWAGLGLWAGTSSDNDRDFLTAVFSLRLPRTPSKVWTMASLSSRPVVDDAPEGPFPALQAVWRQLVLETLVVIVGWRHSRFDPDRAWSAARAMATHAASCHKVLALLAHRRSMDARASPVHANLIMEIRDLFRQGPPASESAQPRSTEAHHLLFFDGGSRGNPGPGGSGACVVRVPTNGDQATILWSAAMSRAHPSTTNNQASTSAC
jgi:hypothetical protein